MNSFPFASIIILNFNGKKWLKGCLDSLERLDYPKEQYEIIVGDNASTDDSVDYIRQNYPKVKVISFDDNYGFCKSNNDCAKQAKGDYLVFLNNDTMVSEQWLKNLVLGALSEPGIVSCASKILFPHLKGGSVVNAAGGRIFITGSSVYEGWMQDDGPQYNVSKYTGFGCGAGVLFEKKFFLKTGGFDEYFFYSIEEMDIGWRAWLYGFKVLYVPSAVMYHYMGQTGFRGKGMTPTIVFLILRNSLYFIVKNFEALTALRGFTFFFIKVFYTAGYALWTGNVPILLAIGKAYACFLKDFGKAWQARMLTQAQRKIKDKELRSYGIFADVLEVFRLSVSGLRNNKNYYSEGLYDAKDVVKVRKNLKGEQVFYRAS